jgi:polysaccharide deacetylase family protein (PEP-CTERM system associated)
MYDSRLTTHDSPALLRNALTIDVEDYFHVSAFANNIRRQNWDCYDSRVERNTQKLLDIFAEHGCRATFFVLGWVAERYPHLVRDIASQGHEIACHGYDHELIYAQTPEVFRRDTTRAKEALENITQTPVYGYRAASFSITRQSVWAFDVLADTGFVYDSSVFPIHHDRYGLPDACDHPHRLNLNSGQTLVEFPLSTLRFRNYGLPVGGGGYFRLYPYAFTRLLLSNMNSKGNPFVFYFHPWEIDPDQPRIRAGWLSTFRHYTNLHRCEKRLDRLLTEFSFAPMKDVLGELGLWDPSSTSASVSGA